MRISSVLMLSFSVVFSLLCWMTRSTYALEAHRGVPKRAKVKRENNLDHWDSDTLAYYLDNYPGYDLAVLFYAKWDRNSQTLAPYWNDIAVKLDAGNSQSKLIMALFDCELNNAHLQLCASASITHYPTMLFIGSGPLYDTDPVSKLLFGKNSPGVMGESPMPNTAKFQGNWQYTPSIMDWIKTMQALSRWHIWSTEGFGKRLRTFFLPKRKGNKALPLGVPGGSSTTGSSSSAATTGVGGKSNEMVEVLETEVETWKNATIDMKNAATRAATMMESVLFNENSTDMFSLLDKRNAWKDTSSYKDLDDIYRACVVEVSMDYCQRLADPMGTKVVDELLASNLNSDELLAASENIETLIMAEVSKKEPYCAILDSCVLSEMKDDACRPKSCPFANDLACRLLTSCESSDVVKQYAEALKLDIDALLPQSS